ncbi:hypothetical protein FPZ54_08350 [Sphingomonas suaedae]|uniref:DUF3187 family protein n=1 Tax=Sphingomonas suaedae TaxID=2599297 RepID=A0A518RF44_9SPHN|nr:hypothetical protein [Sphingomonas suaedae]QDX26034.1 hypothetical protein FPZ54_08350 [Sphingomonas suaedae]
MSMHKLIARTLLVGMAATIVPSLAQAQSAELKLTEGKSPAKLPGASPAYVSYRADFEGEDSINVQVNADVSWTLTSAIGSRDLALGPVLVWNRNSAPKSKQDNLELGGKLDLIDSISCLRHPSRGGDGKPCGLDFTALVEVGYARTAAYPVLDSAVCVATPAARQCGIQHKESLRTSLVIGLTHPDFEAMVHADGKPRFAYSLAPIIGLSHDELSENTIDTKTGIVARGGYTSGLLGMVATISPSFIDPAVELKLSAQIRQRLAASATRRPGIERSAELFTAELNWYFLRPVLEGGKRGTGWYAGMGLTYTNGSDPLVGKDEHTLLLALRVGRF